MFVRVKAVRVKGKRYEYVHVVENHREGARVRQTIVASLGRLDKLEASGSLRRVIEGLVSHCPQVKLHQAGPGALQVETDRCWGPVLIFERLWQELGLADLLRREGQRKRKQFGFDLERCAFALVLQRLVAPGSDLAGSKWIGTMEARGFDSLKLQHFYRTVGQLWKWKGKIEHALYERNQHGLFREDVDVFFFDTTSVYFEGISWAGWANRGFSRDHRYDHLQLIIGVVMRRDGVPITLEIWPGNTADVKTLTPILESLQQRFGIRELVMVCDRGMISAGNLRALSQRGFKYIVGTRMRSFLEVRETVLRRAGRYRVVADNLEVKEVRVDDRRYIVCRNPERAEKDRHDREAIVEFLRSKMRSLGQLVPNRGYRRFLAAKSNVVQIDEAKVRDDARFDGKFVLRTNTDLPAAAVAEAYKNLTWIERLWRELKDVMEVRPIYHHKVKDNVKGHIFASFLAIHLASEFRRRLAAVARQGAAATVPTPPSVEDHEVEPPRPGLPWNDILRDLADLRAMRVRLGEDLYLLRTELKGHANLAFRALNMRVPPLAEVIPPAQ